MKADVAPHTRTGRRGEASVARHLQSRGATILARNARYPAGEADVLAQLPNGHGLLIEVKATAGRYALTPRIDARKKARLFAIAEQAAAAHDLSTIEVQVAAVTLTANRETITLHTLDPW